MLNIQLKEISEKLINSKDHLVAQRLYFDQNIYSEEINTSLYVLRENLVDILSQSLYKDTKYTYNQLELWGNDSVDLFIPLNLPLDAAIEEVRFYRNLIGGKIKDEAVNYNFSLDVFYKIISRFDSVVDRAVYWMSLSYSKKYLSRIQAAESLSLELSVPVIQVSPQIGILPLIGDIDTNRARHLMEKTLTKGKRLGISYLIIDLSGIPVVDTMIANHIINLISALKLIGIKTSLSGIRPEIAKAIVKLDIDLNETPSFGNLQQALKRVNITP